MCDNICCANTHLTKAANMISEPVQYPKQTFSFEANVEGLVVGAEVVGEGSNLMKMMKFPTVMIKVRGGNLQKSRVYHVLLESESEQYSGEMPALLFSKPVQGQRTRFAELFPLSVDRQGNRCISITPMLLRRCHRRRFREGCSFKVKSISGGRFIQHSGKVPWNKWNLKPLAIRNMIAEIVHQDIREMPTAMMRRVTRASLSTTKHLSSLSTSSDSSSQESDKRNLSAHYPSLNLPGLTASGGSSFAKWFKTLPPDVTVDKNFRCARGTTLRKDRFLDLDNFYKYLQISDQPTRTAIVRKPSEHQEYVRKQPLEYHEYQNKIEEDRPLGYNL